jgi:hypothetical protein
MYKNTTRHIISLVRSGNRLTKQRYTENIQMVSKLRESSPTIPKIYEELLISRKPQMFL